jgi:hypothetical protein
MASVLDKLFKFTAERGGVEVICESDTQHLTKEYVIIEVRSPYFHAQSTLGATEDSGEKPPALKLRVCPLCFHQLQLMGHSALASLQQR